MQLSNSKLLVTDAWIGGQVQPCQDRFEVVNPARLTPVADVADCGSSYAKQAIDVAERAQRQWRRETAETRASLLIRWADLINEHLADLSRILVTENGKPIKQAEGEISECASVLRWYARCAETLEVDQPAPLAVGQQNSIRKEPIGVVACITPWNFPAAAVIVKAGAAIAAGCSVVLKPSDETPLIALALARLASEAGLPDGVFNVLPCKRPEAVGDELCRSAKVRMLSFTGSTAVGRKLYAACAETVKKVALELGGNAPFIVFDDADIDAALDDAMGARFYNGGQICVGANRVFVQQAIIEDFIQKVDKRMSELRVGDGMDRQNDLGPVINSASIVRLNGLVVDAVERGARLVRGEQRVSESDLFFTPTLVAGMMPAMQAFRTEVFGPLMCVYAFDEEDQVLELANATEAGLAAYVYSSSEQRCERFTRELEAGVVGVNTTDVFAHDLPFGGIKQSGVGREHGRDCLDAFMEIKSICRVSR